MKVDLRVGIRETENLCEYSTLVGVDVTGDNDEIVRSLDVFASMVPLAPLTGSTSARSWALVALKSLVAQLEHSVLYEAEGPSEFLIPQLGEH